MMKKLIIFCGVEEIYCIPEKPLEFEPDLPLLTRLFAEVILFELFYGAVAKW